MKFNFKRFFSYFSLTVACGFLFTGCFETQFQTKTIVRQDGTVNRETTIDGRGANLFKAPNTSGWSSQTSETKEGAVLLPDVSYHTVAQGHFAAGQVIPSDYEFDIEKQMTGWGEKEKKRLEEVKIKAPYTENLFSKNLIKVNQLTGFLTKTTVYEETFQNKGIIDLLLKDIKEEVRKQSLARGESLQEMELEILARLRLEEEILPEIRFKSELEIPGKIVSSNGKRIGNKIVWEFTLRDFKENYSIYKLEAVSRSLRTRGLIILVVFGGIALIFIVLAATGAARIKSGKSPKKRGPKKV